MYRKDGKKQEPHRWQSQRRGSSSQSKKVKSFILLIILVLILAIGSFFIVKQKVLISKFLGLRQEEQKKEEPKSIAIYCQAHKLSEPETTASVATTSTTNFFMKEEQIIDRCFNMDENGIIFKESPVISGGPFLVIYDRISGDLKINSRVISPEILKSILEIRQKVKINLLSFTIISPIAADLEILTSNGWKIYFDASKDVNKQISILETVLAKKVQPLEYVDLRIENRVYYK